MPLPTLDTFRRCERGNVAVIFALAMVPLFGAAGLAMDYARASSDRARLQTVLDGAVLAGAATPGAEVETATAFFTAAAPDARLDNATATFQLEDGGKLVGSAQGTLPSSLLAALDRKLVTIGVEAAALRREGEDAAPPVSVCILVNDPAASQAFLANSGAKISAPDCEIHVRSTANPAAIVNSGTVLDVKKVCVKGSRTIQNGGPYKVVETDCAAIDDPFAGKLPVVSVPSSCTYNGTNYNANGADVTLPAGNHCNVNINGPRNLHLKPGLYQNININGSPGSINFAPGLYIIKGRINVNGGTLNGTDVTFYYPDANSYIQFNSAVTNNLKAPTTGTYKGILFFEAPNLPQSQFAVNDTPGSAIEGLIWWPSRNLTINSTSHINASKVSLVVNRLILNNTNWKFAPNPDMPMSAAGDTDDEAVQDKGGVALIR